MGANLAGVHDPARPNFRPAVRIHPSDHRDNTPGHLAETRDVWRTRGIQWLEEQTGQHLEDRLPPPWRTVVRIAVQIGLLDDKLVTARLAFIAAVLDDLAGAYDEAGQLAWWHRRRTALGGRSPLRVLTGDVDPKAEPATTVAALARALRGSGA